MKHPPIIKTSFNAIPADPKERHEFMVSVFGQHCIWAIGEALRKMKACVESPDVRSKLAGVSQGVYADFAAKLSDSQQKIAMDLAEKTLDDFAKNILIILTSQGITFRLGEGHAIQYRLTAEIHEAEERKMVFEEMINRNGKKSFSDYWNGWRYLPTESL